MASHVDNTVVERRLRPIYDSLDNGNNKKALQEAEKVLKKRPGNQCARVLKALALFRLGKESECQAIMDKVHSEVPCKDSTLQAMSICYIEMNQFEKICDIYKAALAVDPNNEEFLIHLFMAYVRLRDYIQQKQTAFALYKLKPRNPYLCWAIMSLIMQGTYEINNDLAKDVILPLAEKMVLKFIEQEELLTEQGVELYLMILRLQNKKEEMLKVFLGPLGVNLPYAGEKASVLLELGKYQEAAYEYKFLIIESVGMWKYYPNYIDAALTFQQPTECLNFFEELCKMGKKTRAPYLAKLELLKKTMNRKDYTFKLVDFMLEYFQEMCDKKCVVEDLRSYLTLLTPAEKEELINRITEIVGVTPDGYPNTAEQMQQHIHLEQLRRLCGYHHPPLADLNERERLVKRLYDLYKKGNELFSFADRLPTDFCLADSYILLVGHLLHQLWCETNEASYLYRAMNFLQNGLLSSPANFHIKLILQRIYLEAGLIVPAYHVFASLDIKHIQLDSLGFLSFSLLAPFGELVQASLALDTSIKFYTTNYKDSADHLTSAYKYGNFTKIPEFVDLREHLENSIQFTTITIDKMLLELSCCDSSKSLFSFLANMHIKPSEDRIKWNQLQDNRDLKVIRGWEPVDESGQDPTKESETFECILKLLQARHLILRILAATAESDPSSLLSVLSRNLETLDSIDIPCTLRKVNVDEKTNKSCGILVPLDAVERLKEAHYSEQLKTVAYFAKQLSWQPSHYKNLIEILRTTLCLQPLCLPTHNEPISFKNFLLRASTCSETLAIITAMCVAYSKRFRSVISNKKGKKNEIHENWKAIATFLTEKVQNLDEALTKLMKYPLQTGLENEDNLCVKIMKQGQASLAQSCKSLKSRSQLILKLLSCLKD